MVHAALAGAGIGGLTAALALAARGAAVTLVEQAPELVEAGAGLQLSPNATRVLLGLGLGEALTRIGFAPEAVDVRDAASGRLLLSTSLGEAAMARWSAPYLTVHRADLQQVLLAALAERGVAPRLGAAAVGLDQDDAGVRLRLSGGGAVEADAAIACDGLRSALRGVLRGADKPRYSGQIAWRGLVPADRLPEGLIPPRVCVWLGPGRHFVHYPVRGGSLVNFVGAVDRAEPVEESWTARGEPAEALADFPGWPDPVRALIQSADEVWRWSLYDRPALPAWRTGRATLLGDAAHPMAPFLAQGAAMAIEDAEALARHLDAARRPDAALAAYEAERRPRTARAQQFSARNAALFHLPAPAARLAYRAARTLDAAGRLDWLYGWGR